MKKVANDLKAVARKLSALAEKTEALARRFENEAEPEGSSVEAGRGAVKKTAVKGKSATPTDQVLTLMKRFKKGITVESLRDKSGFNEKQISNIVHRACKKGKMKRLGRGIYSLYDQ